MAEGKFDKPEDRTRDADDDGPDRNAKLVAAHPERADKTAHEPDDTDQDR